MTGRAPDGYTRFMLGFSLGKLLVLAAVIAAVWYGFKYVGKLERTRSGQRKTGERTISERLKKAARNKAGGDARPPDGVEETEQCPVCKAYVAITGVENCGRPGCPY